MQSDCVSSSLVEKCPITIVGWFAKLFDNVCPKCVHCTLKCAHCRPLIAVVNHFERIECRQHTYGTSNVVEFECTAREARNINNILRNCFYTQTYVQPKQFHLYYGTHALLATANR